MAFSYSGDPAANDVDYLRFIIGDTVDNKAIITRRRAKIHYKHYSRK